jgi:hypothetical protein
MIGLYYLLLYFTSYKYPTMIRGRLTAGWQNPKIEPRSSLSARNNNKDLKIDAWLMSKPNN